MVPNMHTWKLLPGTADPLAFSTGLCGLPSERCDLLADFEKDEESMRSAAAGSAAKRFHGAATGYSRHAANKLKAAAIA